MKGSQNRCGETKSEDSTVARTREAAVETDHIGDI